MARASLERRRAASMISRRRGRRLPVPLATLSLRLHPHCPEHAQHPRRRHQHAEHLERLPRSALHGVPARVAASPVTRIHPTKSGRCGCGGGCAPREQAKQCHTHAPPQQPAPLLYTGVAVRCATPPPSMARVSGMKPSSAWRHSCEPNTESICSDGRAAETPWGQGGGPLTSSRKLEGGRRRVKASIEVAHLFDDLRVMPTMSSSGRSTGSLAREFSVWRWTDGEKMRDGSAPRRQDRPCCRSSR
jgi:hypothetical protein